MPVKHFREKYLSFVYSFMFKASKKRANLVCLKYKCKTYKCTMYKCKTIHYIISSRHENTIEMIISSLEQKCYCLINFISYVKNTCFECGMMNRLTITLSHEQYKHKQNITAHL